MERVHDEKHIDLHKKRNEQVEHGDDLVVSFDPGIQLVVFEELNVGEQGEGEADSHDKTGDDDDNAEDSELLNSSMIALKIVFHSRWSVINDGNRFLTNSTPIMSCQET